LSCLVLLKLRKEYLIMVNYKHMLNSRSKYKQIGVSNTFLHHTQKKLFTFKNSPVFFWPILYVPGRNLRSSQSNLLCVPSYKLNFGAHSFRVAAPTVWNSLPADIRACTFYGSFIRQLKTYFNNAF